MHVHSRHPRAALAVLTLAGGVLSANPVMAAGDPQYGYWPSCTSEVTTRCIASATLNGEDAVSRVYVHGDGTININVQEPTHGDALALALKVGAADVHAIGGNGRRLRYAVSGPAQDQTLSLTALPVTVWGANMACWAQYCWDNYQTEFAARETLSLSTSTAGTNPAGQPVWRGSSWIYNGTEATVGGYLADGEARFSAWGANRDRDGNLTQGYAEAKLPDALLSAMGFPDPSAITAQDFLVERQDNEVRTEVVPTNVERVPGGSIVEYAGFEQAMDLVISKRSRRTNIGLTPSANPSAPGYNVTFTATVTAVNGAVQPSGSVTFKAAEMGGPPPQPIGSAPLVDGAATFSTSSLSLGTHFVTAHYDGDDGYNGSTSPTLWQQVGFDDVQPGAPFYDDIYWLAGRGITTGFSDGTFRPAHSVTRQAFASFLYRYDNGADAGPCESGTSAFSDVPDAHPFCGNIKWLANSGITTGFSDGTFQPSALINRQAIATFLYRYNHDGADAGPCALGTSPFPDVPDTHPFCGNIKWLASTTPQAVTTGYSDGTFRPTGAATRQAVAAYFHRYDVNFAG